LEKNDKGILVGFERNMSLRPTVRTGGGRGGVFAETPGGGGPLFGGAIPGEKRFQKKGKTHPGRGGKKKKVVTGTQEKGFEGRFRFEMVPVPRNRTKKKKKRRGEGGNNKKGPVGSLTGALNGIQG